MKILLTVDPEIPVPPGGYGGFERIVDGIAREFKKQGHEVILVAHRDSTSEGASKIYGWKGRSSRGTGNILKNAWQLFSIYLREKPDIVHSFSRLLYLYPIFLFSRIRIIQSYGRPISPKSTGMASTLAGKRLVFTGCATHLYQHLPRQDRWFTVYNFTDTDFFQPADNPNRDYLLFLSRVEDIKGAWEAVRVAQLTGEKLILAGNIEKEHIPYFKDKVKPHLDGKQIKYVGLVDDAQKLPLFQHAKAFLFPIKWEEPFGIVQVEAMACGTPVLAFRRGGVPEIVEDGATGWIVDTLEEMAEKVGELDKLSPEACRKTAVERFSIPRIAADYFDLYQKHLKK